MKYLLIILLFFSVGASAQVLDFEVINECLIDSTSLKGEIKFKRVRVLNTGEIKDYSFDLTGEYTPTGTIKPCDDLEFLDKTCYRQIGGEYCDRGLFNPSNSFNESQIDSVFFDDDIFIPLNYPYLIKTGGSFNQPEYDRYYLDLAAYMDNYGYAYSAFGPGLVVRQTNLVFTRWVRTDFSSNSTSQFSFAASTPTSCVTVIEGEVYEYRNQRGEVKIIIDDVGTVLEELPTLGLNRVNCDLELLDKECYQVIDTLEPVCDYSLNVPLIASSPFDPFVRQVIDSVYFEGIFMPLQNYPYEVQGNNQATGRAQLSDDIRNYYVTNNIEFAYVSGLIVYGTKGALTRNAGRSILQSNTEINIGYNLNAINCKENYSSQFYSLYRDVDGRIQTITTPDSRTIQTLPTGAIRIECCEACEIAAQNACQVQNKTRTILLTGASQIFSANSFYSISAWHISGSLRYQVAGSGPIDFVNHSNFTMSDTSNDPCTYKDAEYLFDTSILSDGNPALEAGQVLIQIHY